MSTLQRQVTSRSILAALLAFPVRCKRVGGFTSWPGDGGRSSLAPWLQDSLATIAAGSTKRKTFIIISALTRYHQFLLFLGQPTIRSSLR